MSLIRKIIAISLFLTSPIQAKHAVAYTLNGGRFGDNLISYMSAAYFSYINKLPLLYKKFEYSELLVLSDLQPRSLLKKNKFTRKIEYHQNIKVSDYDESEPILFFTTFYNRPQPDSSNIEFRKKMRKVIKPKIEIIYPDIPKNHVSVALHIRTGGGFRMDSQLYTKYPTRFAPLHFYKDQIKRLLLLYPEQKLYVHIFTDDKNPERMVEYFQKEIITNCIIYGFRRVGNVHNRNVLEDFFFMLKFKCLVRPTSNFSKAAEFLGNYDFVMVPATYHKIDEKNWIIDSIRFTKKTFDGKIKSRKVSCAPGLPR